MTRADREHLLQRYLDGAMSSAEEEEFLIRAALNTDLRMELKAHQTIDRALRKDRTGALVEHTTLRSRVAATLAASAVPEAASSVSSSTPASAPQAGAASTTSTGWWGAWSGSIVLGTAGLIVTLMLTLNPFGSATPEPLVRPANTVIAPAPSSTMTPPAQSSQQVEGATSPSTGAVRAERNTGSTASLPRATAEPRSREVKSNVRTASGARTTTENTTQPAADGKLKRSTRDPLDVNAKVKLDPVITPSKQP